MTNDENLEDRFNQAFKEGEESRLQQEKERDQKEQVKEDKRKQWIEEVIKIRQEILEPLLEAFGKASGDVDNSVQTDFVADKLIVTRPFQINKRIFEVTLSIEPNSNNSLASLKVKEHTGQGRSADSIREKHKDFPTLDAQTIKDWLGKELEEVIRTCMFYTVGH